MVKKTIIRTRVEYLHHTRDRDGDVVFYFLLPPSNEIHQSSPVIKVNALNSAVLDKEGRGGLKKCILVTQNTVYETTIPKDKIDHLQMEVGN